MGSEMCIRDRYYHRYSCLSSGRCRKVAKNIPANRRYDRAAQGRFKNHADPCDHGAEGDIEQEVQDVRPFIVAEHMRPYDALQLGIKMREEV